MDTASVSQQRARLPKREWLEVVQRAPLVSIDLIVTNTHGEVLLGWRSNQPAQHHWFVPGGVVRKGETLQQAFERTVLDELGVATRLNRLGVFDTVYEHHYAENFANEAGFGTHYVVLAHRVNVQALNAHGETPEAIHDAGGLFNLDTLPKAQHTEYAWMAVPQLLVHKQVHPMTKAYFQA